jgi:hypothetical protein
MISFGEFFYRVVIYRRIYMHGGFVDQLIGLVKWVPLDRTEKIYG